MPVGERVFTDVQQIGAWSEGVRVDVGLTHCPPPVSTPPHLQTPILIVITWSEIGA